MKHSTGFYRVYICKYKKNTYYEYQIKNKIVNMKIRDKNPVALKMKVQEAGFLWGVVDVETALITAKRHRVKPELLEGRYGKKLTE